MSAPTLDAPRSRRQLTKNNFELNAWLFMRISGVVLIILVLGHLFIMQPLVVMRLLEPRTIPPEHLPIEVRPFLENLLVVIAPRRTISPTSPSWLASRSFNVATWTRGTPYLGE